jgi:phage virion morphogenesis protein
VAGASITVDSNTRQVRDLVAELRGKLEYMTPLMKIIGAIIQASVQKNFEEGGRPKWAPLSPVTLLRRKSSGGPLVVQGFAGGLLGSISYKATERKVTIGTNKIYGAVQQFGAGKGAFGQTSRGAPIPWGDIPARPYLMVQDEDWTEIGAEVKEYLVGSRQ